MYTIENKKTKSTIFVVSLNYLLGVIIPGNLPHWPVSLSSWKDDDYRIIFMKNMKNTFQWSSSYLYLEHGIPALSASVSVTSAQDYTATRWHCTGPVGLWSTSANHFDHNDDHHHPPPHHLHNHPHAPRHHHHHYIIKRPCCNFW